MTSIFKEFRLEVAHRLPMVPEGHKCARLHGHSLRVEVHVTGEVHPATGWIVDFADVSAAFQTHVHDKLDHRYLNEIDGLFNPTSEWVARWIWTALRPVLPGVSRIVVRETCTSGCVYDGGA